MQKFSNIVLIGPMGAGKTSIGKALAQAIDWNFYDSDQIVEERAGADLLWIYDLEGEEGFHRREQKVISELIQERNIVLATGGSTVAIPENRAVIAANSLVIYLRTSLSDQVVRTGYSKKRPLSVESKERYDTLKKLRKEHEPIYEDLADVVYDTDNRITRTAVSDLMKIVENHR